MNKQPHTQSQPLAICAAELADLLGISKRHVATLKSSGRLPSPLKFGRRCVWVLSEIEAWLDAGAPARDQWEALKQKEKVHG